jgi:hypothetical protein
MVVHLILALERLKWDYEFKAILGNIDKYCQREREKERERERERENYIYV